MKGLFHLEEENPPIFYFTRHFFLFSIKREREEERAVALLEVLHPLEESPIWNKYEAASIYICLQRPGSIGSEGIKKKKTKGLKVQQPERYGPLRPSNDAAQEREMRF